MTGKHWNVCIHATASASDRWVYSLRDQLTEKHGRRLIPLCSLGSTSNHACLSTREHQFVYKQDFPSTSICPHNGRPSLSVKPLYREECKCCGVDQGWGHAPTFRAHQCTWISEEGTLEVRSTLPCSFCRSLEEMPVDRMIDRARLRRNTEPPWQAEKEQSNQINEETSH